MRAIQLIVLLLLGIVFAETERSPSYFHNCSESAPELINHAEMVHKHYEHLSELLDDKLISREMLNMNHFFDEPLKMDNRGTFDLIEIINGHFPRLPEVVQKIDNSIKEMDVFGQLKDIIDEFQSLPEDGKVLLTGGECGSESSRDFFYGVVQYEISSEGIDKLQMLYKIFEGPERSQLLRELLNHLGGMYSGKKYKLRELMETTKRDECLVVAKEFADLDLLSSIMRILDVKLNMTSSCVKAHNLTFDYTPNMPELIEYWKSNPILHDGTLIDKMKYSEKVNTDALTETGKLFKNFGIAKDVAPKILDFLSNVETLVRRDSKFYDFVRFSGEVDGFDFGAVTNMIRKYKELHTETQLEMVQENIRPAGYKPLVTFFRKIAFLEQTESFIQRLQQEVLPQMRKSGQVHIDFLVHFLETWFKLGLAEKERVETSVTGEIGKEECMKIWNEKEGKAYKMIVSIDEHFGVETCFTKYQLE